MMPAFSLGLSVSGLEACKMKVNRLTSMETDQAKRSPSFDKVVRVLLYIFMWIYYVHVYERYMFIMYHEQMNKVLHLTAGIVLDSSLADPPKCHVLQRDPW